MWLILASAFIVSLIGSEGLRIQELVPTYEEGKYTKIYVIVIDEATELEHIVVLNSLMTLKQPNLLIETNLPYIIYYSGHYEVAYSTNLCVMYRMEKSDRHDLFLFIQRKFYSKADFEWEECFREAYDNGIMSLIFDTRVLRAGIISG
jgi:hypothetical protein